MVSYTSHVLNDDAESYPRNLGAAKRLPSTIVRRVARSLGRRRSSHSGGRNDGQERKEIEAHVESEIVFAGAYPPPTRTPFIQQE